VRNSGLANSVPSASHGGTTFFFFLHNERDHVSTLCRNLVDLKREYIRYEEIPLIMYLD